jgi:hypothetical protein
MSAPRAVSVEGADFDVKYPQPVATRAKGAVFGEMNLIFSWRRATQQMDLGPMKDN